MHGGLCTTMKLYLYEYWVIDAYPHSEPTTIVDTSRLTIFIHRLNIYKLFRQLHILRLAIPRRVVNSVWWSGFRLAPGNM